MPDERAISKVILNGAVQMDVTQDTVTAQTLQTAYTATGADGKRITGVLELPPNGDLLGYGLNTSDLVNVGAADYMILRDTEYSNLVGQAAVGYGIL